MHEVTIRLIVVYCRALRNVVGTEHSVDDVAAESLGAAGTLRDVLQIPPLNVELQNGAVRKLVIVRNARLNQISTTKPVVNLTIYMDDGECRQSAVSAWSCSCAG